MLPIGHFALGAALGLLILTFVRFKGKLKYDILIIPLSGAWAMIPDAGALWGDYLLDDNPLMDVFWFHYTIDQNLSDTVETTFPFLIVMGIILLFYCYKMKVIK